MKSYLNTVKSSELRCFMSKLRMDVNNTNDCRTRSFRYKNKIDKKCPHCNVPQSVHVLLDCNKTNFEQERQKFTEKYNEYVPNYVNMSVDKKLCEILNVKPSCNPDVKDKAVGTICSFLKNVKQEACRPNKLHCKFNSWLRKRAFGAHNSPWESHILHTSKCNSIELKQHVSCASKGNF